MTTTFRRTAALLLVMSPSWASAEPVLKYCLNKSSVLSKVGVLLYAICGIEEKVAEPAGSLRRSQRQWRRCRLTVGGSAMLCETNDLPPGASEQDTQRLAKQLRERIQQSAKKLDSKSGDGWTFSNTVAAAPMCKNLRSFSIENLLADFEKAKQKSRLSCQGS